MATAEATSAAVIAMEIALSVGELAFSLKPLKTPEPRTSGWSLRGRGYAVRTARVPCGGRIEACARWAAAHPTAYATVDVAVIRDHPMNMFGLAAERGGLAALTLRDGTGCAARGTATQADAEAQRRQRSAARSMASPHGDRRFSGGSPTCNQVFASLCSVATRPLGCGAAVWSGS